jgi:hypothetical protein
VTHAARFSRDLRAAVNGKAGGKSGHKEDPMEVYRVLLSVIKNGQAVIVNMAPIMAESKEDAGEKALTLIDVHFADKAVVLMVGLASHTSTLVHRPDESGE